MARISSYNNDADLTSSDRVLGTNEGGQNTTNFRISDIGRFFSKSGDVAVSRQIPFVFHAVWQDERPHGSITYENQGIFPLEATSTLIVSKQTAGNKLISNFMTYAVNSVVYIFMAEDPNVFAEYKVTSITTYDSDTNFYKVRLQYIAGQGELEHKAVVGFAVESKASGDKNYMHQQLEASEVWEISHGLGKQPSITIQDSAGTQVQGEIHYIDTNNLRITFSSAFKGKAYLN